MKILSAIVIFSPLFVIILVFYNILSGYDIVYKNNAYAAIILPESLLQNVVVQVKEVVPTLEKPGIPPEDIELPYIPPEPELKPVMKISPKFVPDGDREGAPTSSTPGFTAYVNINHGISILYPSNWKKTETDSDPNDSVTEIVQFHPSTGSRAVIDVGIAPKGSSLGLEEYLQSLISSYGDSSGGIHVNRAGIDKDSETPTYNLLFTTANDRDKIMEKGTIVGDKVYYMRYITEPSRYSTYLQYAEHMDSSFTIIR